MVKVQMPGTLRQVMLPGGYSMAAVYSLSVRFFTRRLTI
jgi:hypothetical protein